MTTTEKIVQYAIYQNGTDLLLGYSNATATIGFSENSHGHQKLITQNLWQAKKIIKNNNLTNCYIQRETVITKLTKMKKC